MEDDSIDIIALVKTVWTEKKLVLKVVYISFVIGCTFTNGRIGVSPLRYVWL